MGSPNFGGNSKGIDVPMYAITLDLYDELENGSQSLENWVVNNDLTTQDIIDGCGVDISKVSTGEADILDDWARENGYYSPLKYVEEDLQELSEEIYQMGEEAADNVNDALDTDLLYVEIQNGYWNGYCVMTESPYWDSAIYNINYEYIADDYNVSVEEARKMFAEQIDIVKRMLKSEFGGIGWRPHTGGYTGSFYEE